MYLFKLTLYASLYSYKALPNPRSLHAYYNIIEALLNLVKIMLPTYIGNIGSILGRVRGLVHSMKEMLREKKKEN